MARPTLINVMQQYKRTNFLINKRFQLRFAFFVCSWIFALSMIYPIVIFNIFEFFIKGFADGNTVVPTLTSDKVKLIENQVLVVLGIIQLVFLGITFILTIFLSHRIAGPLFKLKRAIDDVKNGNVDQKIYFRKNDHFIELQDSFNEMVQYLSSNKK